MSLTNGNFNNNIDNEIMKRFELLLKVAEEFSSSLDLEKVIDRVLSRVKEVLECDASSILLYDREVDKLRFYAASGAGASVIKSLLLEKNVGFAGWVFTNSKPIISNGVESDERFYPGIDRITGIKTKTLICVPIEREGGILGVIEAINKYDGVFREDDLELLQAIARYAGIAIENAIIHRELENKNNELTGVNRDLEAFLDVITHELQTPLSSIKGYTDLMKKNIDSEKIEIEQHREYLQRIESNYNVMSRFIRNILAVISLKKDKLEKIEFNPRSVIQEIISVYHENFKAKGIQIKLGWFPSQIVYDNRIFYQIYDRLLRNYAELLKTSDAREKIILNIGSKEKEDSYYKFFIFDSYDFPLLDEAAVELSLEAVKRRGVVNRDFLINTLFIKKAVELNGGEFGYVYSDEQGNKFWFTVPH